MSKYNEVGLYEHNEQGYDLVKEGYENSDIVGIVHATGTGKTYIGTQLVYDNKDKKALWLVPSNSIIEHIKKTINDNPNLDMERDFPNLEFMTYQNLVNMSIEEIEKLDIDLLILDEFHHIGAPVWGKRVETIIETHPNIQVFGMTAYTVRDRGTSYERDMAEPGGDELFSDNIVSRYDLCDAMVDGVLPKPIYKSSYVKLIGIAKELEDIVKRLEARGRECSEYYTILSDIKKRLHQAPSVSDILTQNIKMNGKYIYFCPPAKEEGTNDIETIKKEALEWFKGIAKEEDIVFYTSLSEMEDSGRLQREAFYDDLDLDGNKVDNKLRVMFCINQYNEGVHAPNIDGVILGRGTCSDIVFFEQIGRALCVKGNTLKKIEQYEEYPIESLRQMCIERNIDFNNDNSKMDLIEKIISPVIIDLAGNIDFIKELEDNLKDRIKELQEKGNGTLRRRKLTDASFDLDILELDLLDILMELKQKTKMTWEEWYELAKKYYQEHGNLEVPESYVTANGEKLGIWIRNQRYTCNPESEHGKLLSQIGMRFETKVKTWEEWYELAKKNYQEHGNLEVPDSYVTANGEKLGIWIRNQRYTCNPESEHGKLLSKIGMRFENIRNTMSWEEWYEYAKKYFKKYGNLEVPAKFIINDKGKKIKLGMWIHVQRRKCDPESEHGKLLSQIGMRFETKVKTWEEWYELAKKYYQEHLDLEVPVLYVTANGEKLGEWVRRQRKICDPESEHGKLLSKIGMRFENVKNIIPWEEWYEYAKKYSEKHGTLEIPKWFKTNDGFTYNKLGKINLGMWIQNQRRKCDPESEHGKLLSQIGMRFETKVKTWEEWYELAKKYYQEHLDLEVPVQFKIDNEGEIINLGTWIQRQRKSCDPESEHGKLLSQIGMRFESIKSIMSWEEWYELAKKYYQEHGNLKVHNKYVTENGEKLGSWLCDQRKKYKKGKMSNEQIIMLESIGMIWDVKKNKSDVEDLCIENNIDINKNKIIISHISYIEFKVKLSFLKDNGMNIVDNNGMLHEIFSMSNTNMKLKYNVSLEELINMYKEKNK